MIFQKENIHIQKLTYENFIYNSENYNLLIAYSNM